MKTTTKEISEKLTAALDAAGYEYVSILRIIPNLGSVTLYEYNAYHAKGSFKWIDMPPAFTMCELWQMLPNCITIKHDNYIKIMTGADVFYTDEYDDLLVNELYYPDKNPCDALAKLVLWCIENGHELNLKKKDQ